MANNRPCCTNPKDVCTLYLCDEIVFFNANEAGTWEFYLQTGFGEFVKQFNATIGSPLLLDTCGLNEQCSYTLQIKSPSGVWVDDCWQFNLRIKNIIEC
jgi:hypothetical protein